MSTPPPGYRGAFRDDADACAVYAEAAGIGRSLPRAVARPADVESVQALVRWAAARAMPITPRGSGSSMAGGAIGDGLIVDLGALHDIAPIDTTTRTVPVGPGAIRNSVDRAARAHGLRFAVDPSSGAFCTIGGMIATNAAGARSLSFGATRDSVRALDCVFPDGTRAEVRRGADWRAITPLARLAASVDELRELRGGRMFARSGLRKESSGYALDAFLDADDVVDLLVGSEGTLCIVVGAELALLPVATATSTILAAFDTLEEAVAAAVHGKAAAATACELLDRTFLDMARAGGHAADVPTTSEAVLLVEVESRDGESAAARARVIATLFREHGAHAVTTAMEPVAEAELWDLRHAASPSIARLHPELRSMQFIEDGAVPAAGFTQYVRGIRDILAHHETPGVIFGHAGDAHAHVNPLVDVSREGWRERVEAILDDATNLVAELGGTIAAEHGDGRVRTPLLARVWEPRACAAFARVKRAVDPDGLLNPGVKVPLDGQRPLELIKYDPGAPALPARAAAALRLVERERAYGRSRLELLDAQA